MRLHYRMLLLCCFLLVFMSSSSMAIPAFARQYGTACTTCHIDFPKLNDFGKAFKDAGFKFPKDDEDFIKIPPVMLGAAAQKELWPKTIWPGVIPGMPPISVEFFAALFGPAKLPADTAARLSAELNAAIARPKIREQTDRQGFTLAGSTPAELGAFVKQQLGAWSQGFRDAGINPE